MAFDLRKQLGLPVRPFLYTVDQIAGLLDVEVGTVKTQYVFFVGRSTGRGGSHLMQARNIAPPEEKPEWRVAEREFMRWMKTKGFRIYEVNIVAR